MEIRGVNNIQYWTDAGSLNYTRVNSEASSIFAIMAVIQYNTIQYIKYL